MLARLHVLQLRTVFGVVGGVGDGPTLSLQSSPSVQVLRVLQIFVVTFEPVVDFLLPVVTVGGDPGLEHIDWGSC